MPSNNAEIAILDDELLMASAQYGHAAARLSEKIETLESELRQLTGKVEVRVVGKGITVEFCRREGSGWILWCKTLGEPIPIRDASVQVKAKAALYFPELLHEMSRVLKHETSRAKAATEMMRLININQG